MIQIYTGNGKGKSTAAFGLALRAAGQGLKVVIVQFCKNDSCGEHESLRRLGIHIDAGEPIGGPPWESAFREQWRVHSRKQLDAAKDLVGKCDMLILDEAMGALAGGLIEEEKLDELIADWPEEKELIMTGREATQALIEKADLVTEMKCVKHYFDKKVSARRGIEY